MSVLTQANFPRLWHLFQVTVGATRDKRETILAQYRGEQRILEVGCATGNLARAFAGMAQLEYTGVDIDEDALAVARERFAALKNFRFTRRSLPELAAAGEKFDLIILSNVLHHLDDAATRDMLSQTRAVAAGGASIVILEPELMHGLRNPLRRFLYALEQGKFRRGREPLLALVVQAGLGISSSESLDFRPNVAPFFKVWRMSLVRAAPQA